MNRTTPSTSASSSSMHREPTADAFDFTGSMHRLCTDMVSRVAQLSHIRMAEVAVSFAQARRPVTYGLQASLTPLRFENGDRQGVQNGRHYAIQTVLGAHGRPVLYILNFYLPRFMQQPFHEKLVTIFHELWHINPEFNGDIRRFPGRCYMHSSRQCDFDEQAKSLSENWLKTQPPTSLYDFLHLDFQQLRRQYGRVIGIRIPQPRLIPIRKRPGSVS